MRASYEFVASYYCAATVYRLKESNRQPNRQPLRAPLPSHPSFGLLVTRTRHAAPATNLCSPRRQTKRRRVSARRRPPRHNARGRRFCPHGRGSAAGGRRAESGARMVSLNEPRGTEETGQSRAAGGRKARGVPAWVRDRFGRRDKRAAMMVSPYFGWPPRRGSK